MSRSSLLRRVLQDFLLSVCARVYYQRAAPEAAFPRLVFDLPNSFDDGQFEVYRLEVDGWDDSSDTSVLEDLMAAVDGDGDMESPTGLHRKVLSTDDLTATVFRESRLSLIDDDERLRRRQYVYAVKVYKG